MATRAVSTALRMSQEGRRRQGRSQPRQYSRDGKKYGGIDRAGYQRQPAGVQQEKCHQEHGRGVQQQNRVWRKQDLVNSNPSMANGQIRPAGETLPQFNLCARPPAGEETHMRRNMHMFGFLFTSTP